MCLRFILSISRIMFFTKTILTPGVSRLPAAEAFLTTVSDQERGDSDSLSIGQILARHPRLSISSRPAKVVLMFLAMLLTPGALQVVTVARPKETVPGK